MKLKWNSLCTMASFIVLSQVHLSCKNRAFNNKSNSYTFKNTDSVEGLVSIDPDEPNYINGEPDDALSLKVLSAGVLEKIIEADEKTITKQAFGVVNSKDSTSRRVNVRAVFKERPNRILEQDLETRKVNYIPLNVTPEGVVKFAVQTNSNRVYFPIFEKSDMQSPLFESKPVNIVENSNGKISLRLGKLHGKYRNYIMNVYRGNDLIINAQRVNLDDGGFASFAVPNNGYYRIEFTSPPLHDFDSPRVLWAQNVFSQHKSRAVIKDEERLKIAEKYAPVVMFHDTEQYFPVSLEYLFNKENPDAGLNSEIYSIQGPLGGKNIAFKDLESQLPFFGDNRSLVTSANFRGTRMKMRGQQIAKSSIYYSFIEDAAAGKLFLNYHFFYCFDPKSGSGEHPGFGSHIFDRESFSVVLDLKTLTPEKVIYNQHQENQEVGMLDENNKVQSRWQKGRISVAWDEVFKVGEHVIANPAKGSHAIYQAMGMYKILNIGGFPVEFLPLNEPAGGTIRVIKPENLTSKQNFPNYELKELEFDELTSASKYKSLAFSGFMVDVPGPVDAHFPPFLEREMTATSWASGAATWTQQNMPASNREKMLYFIKGF